MKPFALFLFALSLAAQNPAADRTTERSRVGTGVEDPVVDFYDSMSDYFRQSVPAIAAIKKKGIPDEEIPAVLLIARRSSASPNQVIEGRKAGKEWAEIAKQHKVEVPGQDFVREANVIFLSQYHGLTPEKVRAMLDKGATYIAVNQELRRAGGMRKATERPAQP